jgi:hypothetical protein
MKVYELKSPSELNLFRLSTLEVLEEGGVTNNLL